jgi:hypothetical protein
VAQLDLRGDLDLVRGGGGGRGWGGVFFII